MRQSNGVIKHGWINHLFRRNIFSGNESPKYDHLRDHWRIKLWDHEKQFRTESKLGLKVALSFFRSRAFCRDLHPIHQQQHWNRNKWNSAINAAHFQMGISEGQIDTTGDAQVKQDDEDVNSQSRWTQQNERKPIEMKIKRYKDESRANKQPLWCINQPQRHVNDKSHILVLHSTAQCAIIQTSPPPLKFFIKHPTSPQIFYQPSS